MNIHIPLRIWSRGSCHVDTKTEEKRKNSIIDGFLFKTFEMHAHKSGKKPFCFESIVQTDFSIPLDILRKLCN